MKRIYYIMTALLFCAASVNAQVRIGSNDDPHQGAILDLQSTETTGKGILFPLVELANVEEFQLGGTATKGMMVFNISESTVGGKGAGVYVWNGSKWLLSGETASAPAIVQISGIALSGETTVDTGNSIHLMADITPEHASMQTVLWTVSNGTGSAVIDALSGTLTGVTAGTVSVYATAMDGSGVQASYSVTVNPVAVTGIAIIGSSSVASGASIALGTTVIPANASNQKVTWSVTNGTGSATIDATSGFLLGITPGTVSVTATAQDGSGISAEKTITVESSNIPVSSITITGANSVNAKETITLGVNVLPVTASNKGVNWSVTNGTGTATITAAGVLTGTAAGTVTVKASAQDGSGITSATHTVTVNAAAIPGYNLTVANGIYNKNYSGDYLTAISDGASASTVKTHFTATNKTLYVQDEDILTGYTTWGNAINACSAAGGRLPTLYELAQLQMTQGAYGLRSLSYWSSTESSSSTAWSWAFSAGVANNFSKSLAIYVRCVRSTN